MTLGNELLRFNKEQKYILFDKETEGLNHRFSRPYQLSYIIFTLDDIISQHDEYLLWDDLDMSEGAAKKTNFNYSLYKSKAVNPKDVLDRFENYIYDPQYRPVGHNILGYDTMIHQVVRRALGMKIDYSYLSRCIDTLALSKAHRIGVKPDTKNLLAWQFKMVRLILEKKDMPENADGDKIDNKTKLIDMAKEFKIKCDEKRMHEALYDCTINREVFKQLLYKFDL